MHPLEKFLCPTLSVFSFFFFFLTLSPVFQGGAGGPATNRGGKSRQDSAGTQALALPGRQTWGGRPGEQMQALQNSGQHISTHVEFFKAGDGSPPTYSVIYSTK